MSGVVSATGYHMWPRISASDLWPGFCMDVVFSHGNTSKRTIKRRDHAAIWCVIGIKYGRAHVLCKILFVRVCRCVCVCACVCVCVCVLVWVCLYACALMLEYTHQYGSCVDVPRGLAPHGLSESAQTGMSVQVWDC